MTRKIFAALLIAMLGFAAPALTAGPASAHGWHRHWHHGWHHHGWRHHGWHRRWHRRHW